jgi:alpha-L-arabinofuranosidase
MDEYDPQRNIKLIYDEWGAWHPVESGKPMGGLFQQNTMRDALVAAITLDVFNNQADKVFMANIAQMINVLQSLLLVKDDCCIKTPTYHIFDMYRPHKGANAVRFLTAGESLKALEGSASVKDGILCVTACNTHPTEAIDFELETRGGKMAEARVVALAGKDMLALNTFDKPNAVKISKAAVVKGRGNLMRIEMPAGSVVRVMGKIA